VTKRFLLQVRASEELVKALDRFRLERGVTRQDVVAQLLAEALEKYRQPNGWPFRSPLEDQP
jgi:metal-responsive CopG/Arc/MetJ family transcriptional regulator